MNFTAIVFLAFAMSTDAFAAAIGKGCALGKTHFFQALKIGLLFGIVEAITPLIGWTIGSFAFGWALRWDHWIAFFLLFGIGANMIWMGYKDDANEPENKQKNHSVVMLALTALATSIDALAIGIGLAFINVNIWIVAAAIGTTTTIMVTTGVLLGRYLGNVIGKWAEIFGGVVLISVGIIILYEHLTK